MRILVIFVLLSISQITMAESIFMIPGESWGFQFNSPKLERQKGNTSATEYQFEASTQTGFVLSAFVEPANGKGTNSVTCMEYYWALSSKNPSIQIDTVKVVSKEPFAIVTYLIEMDYKGQSYIQSNANYYGYRDGKCIDFHISQVFPVNTKIDYSNMLEFGKTFGYFK